ncbi:MAG: DUF2764 family protein [Rikenellaceae bacterium]
MFAKEYIALIAGLREYSLDGDNKGLELSAILEEVFDEISAKDSELVRLLYGLYDCENIVATYNKSERFNPMGFLSRESIDTLLSGVESDDIRLSASQQAVVELYTAKGSEQGGEDFEMALYAAYYADAESSKNRFLREWSRSERDLRNVIAALSARSSGRAVESVLVGGGDVVDQIMRSSAADFALRGQLSYLDALMAAVADRSNLIEQEHKIDNIRWEVAEELAQMEYFTMDALLAYLVRVNMVVRWQRLNPKYGREMFDRLVGELRANKK